MTQPQPHAQFATSPAPKKKVTKADVDRIIANALAQSDIRRMMREAKTIKNSEDRALYKWLIETRTAEYGNREEAERAILSKYGPAPDQADEHYGKIAQETADRIAFRTSDEFGAIRAAEHVADLRNQHAAALETAGRELLASVPGLKKIRNAGWGR